MTDSVFEALHDIALLADGCDSVRHVEIVLTSSGVTFRTGQSRRTDKVVPWLTLQRARFPKDILRSALREVTS